MRLSSRLGTILQRATYLLPKESRRSNGFILIGEIVWFQSFTIGRGNKNPD